MRATDAMIGGKRVLTCGNGDESKGCAFAMRDAGVRVLVTEMDPIYALQACMVGFQVVKMEDVVGEVDRHLHSSYRQSRHQKRGAHKKDERQCHHWLL